MAEAAAANIYPDFDKLIALIREEWPGVAEADLRETGGDVDRVVALVARVTEHTKALARRQVAELASLVEATEDAPSSATDALAARVEAALRRLEQQTAGLRGQASDVVGRASELAGRANEVADHVRRDLVPEAEEKVRENLLTSLLVALGLGMILGLIVGGSFGRGR